MVGHCCSAVEKITGAIEGDEPVSHRWKDNDKGENGMEHFGPTLEKIPISNYLGKIK
jgi:hypothetical protein